MSLSKRPGSSSGASEHNKKKIKQNESSTGPTSNELALRDLSTISTTSKAYSTELAIALETNSYIEGFTQAVDELGSNVEFQVAGARERISSVMNEYAGDLAVLPKSQQIFDQLAEEVAAAFARAHRRAAGERSSSPVVEQSPVEDPEKNVLSWPDIPPMEVDYHSFYAKVQTSVAPAKYITNLLWTRIKEIHEIANTNGYTHPMFGPAEQGKFRLPLKTSTTKGKGETSNWEKRCVTFGNTIEKNMQDETNPYFKGARKFIPGSCWMVRDLDFSLQLGKQVTKRFKIHRFLAYLRDGSPAAWIEFDTKSSPGLHFCHNGKVDDDKWACANGLQHVWLGTTQENNEQKDCARKAVTSCPSHTPHHSLCIYVWTTKSLKGSELNAAQKRGLVRFRGRPRPCLNDLNTERVSAGDCGHTPNCFDCTTSNSPPASSQ